jgi:hypothetical protein
VNRIARRREVSLTELFLIILGAAWLVVFLPRVLIAKRRTPLFQAASWRQRMRSIAAPRISSTGRWVVAPRSSGAIDRGARRALKKRQQRRKLLLFVLLALVPLSLLVALWRGAWLWNVHFASYAVLAVYVALLVEERRVRSEGTEKVRALGSRRGDASASGDFMERRA